MGQLTPQFLIDLETNMKVVSVQDYDRLNAHSNWQKFATTMPSVSRKERLTWLLDTAKISYVNRLGGEVTFEDILSQTVEYESLAATGGLELLRTQLDDHDGNGVKLAAHWARGMGAYAAYWPQKQVTTAIRNGALATSLGYDSQIFFSAAHPINPFNTGLGTFANVFTGGASGSYPGACPIDPTNAATLDVALNNLAKIRAYIQSIKMPNGEDPRGLRVSFIAGPPALASRMQQLTNAKFLAQAAASGGGSGDIEAVVNDQAYGQPIVVDELGASFTNGSDTDFYVGVEAIGSQELGALCYINREPFGILFNDQMTDSQLARANKLQWMTRGRNVVVYGHPFLLFKCKGT